MFIDIGNTNIKIKKSSNSTIKTFLSSDKHSALKFILSNYSNKTIYVSSVVTELSNYFLKKFKSKNLRYYFFTNKNKYSFSYKAKGMGVDRLLADEGALEKYTAPLIIVDAGSAITLEYISASKVLEGGLILPGLRLGVEVLYNYASLLPLVNYNKVLNKTVTRKQMFLSNTTDTAITYGLLVPVLSCLEDIFNTFNTKKNLKIILTGGDAKYIFNNLKIRNKFYEKDLVFQGIKSLIERGSI